jgi:site-specific recombinase XerD
MNPFDEKRVRDKCSLFHIGLDPERAQTQTEFMSRDEVDRLLTCKKSLRSEVEDKEWNVLIHLLRFGGGRVSSYLVLRWKDINFETGFDAIGRRDPIIIQRR